MQVATKASAIVGAAICTIGGTATGLGGDGFVASAILAAVAATGTYFGVKENPAVIDKLAQMAGSKFPWLKRYADLIRQQNQQALADLRAARRRELINQLEALRTEELEWLGAVEAPATPDDLESLTLDELTALRNGQTYRETEEAVALARRHKALRERLEYVNDLFSDASNVIQFTSKEYMDRNPQLRKFLRSKIHQEVNGNGEQINTSSGAAATASIIGNSVGAYQRAGAQEAMEYSIECLQFGRAIHDLKPNERAVLRTYSLLDAYGATSPGARQRLHDVIAFNDGNCVTGNTATKPGRYHYYGMKMAEEAIRESIVGHHEAIQMALTEFRTLANHEDETIAELVREAFESGNSWANASDVQKSDVYKPYEEGTADLLLGWYEDETPVGFGGYESLITIARPGTGKTQSQVIPNLLTYPGSVIALDVKGELYDATAATRAEKFGKVIKLDLRTVDESHKYNPLTFCNQDKAWTEARFIADQLTEFSQDTQSQSSNSSDYFNGRARDIIQAFTAFLLMNEETPHISSILDMLSPTKPEFISYVVDMRNAENKNLNRYANTLENMEDKQREAVFDTARGKLNIFEDEIIDQLTSNSDWRPEDLREQGTTLYLCVPEGGIASYAPLLRLIIGQHLDLFDAPEAGRPDLPLTCFLDEFPQLGQCQPLEKATETGRGRGIRLWMFAQDHEQITDTYNQGIIDRCAIEMYMKPADKTAEHLSKILGETEDIFTGEKKSLAAIHDLLGEKFSDKVIIKATGSKPVVVAKRMAHEQ